MTAALAHMAGSCWRRLDDNTGAHQYAPDLAALVLLRWLTSSIAPLTVLGLFLLGSELDLAGWAFSCG